MWLTVAVLLVANQVVSSTLDVKEKYIGCYVDKGVRDLPYLKGLGGQARVEFCIEHCRQQGYKYAGLQNALCFCGDTYGKYGKAVNEEKCHKYTCKKPNNDGKIDYCGGILHSAIYKTNAKPESENIKSEGCFIDKGLRDLETHVGLAYISRERCYQKCKSQGYNYFGLQKTLCFCGNYFGRYGKVDDAQCKGKCTGTWENECGGLWRTNVFPIPKNMERKVFKYVGCYKEQGPLDLRHLVYAGPLMRHDYCISKCYSQGYQYAGLKVGNHCFCGNSYGRHHKLPDTECYKSPCRKPNKNSVYETCGSGIANRIYNTGYKLKSAGLKSLGCFIDKGARDLDILYAHGVKVSKEYCYRYCEERGYRYFGLQHTHICTCGHKYGRYGKTSDSECSMKCVGNWKETCGGSLRNNIFDIQGERHEEKQNEESLGRDDTLDNGNNKGDNDNLNYLGCYKDEGIRDLAKHKVHGQMDLEWCVTTCKQLNYRYAGIQHRVHCFCGNSYGRYSKRPEDECTKFRCVRVTVNQNSYDSCGGALRNRIYDTIGKTETGEGSKETETSSEETKTETGKGSNETETKPEETKTEIEKPTPTNKIVCVDPYTNKRYVENEKWTTKTGSYCFHFVCKVGVNGPVNIDCMDKYNKCIAATRQGNEFDCRNENYSNCKCVLSGNKVIMQYVRQ